jgi:hypothetical protein
MNRHTCTTKSKRHCRCARCLNACERQRGGEGQPFWSTHRSASLEYTLVSLFGVHTGQPILWLVCVWSPWQFSRSLFRGKADKFNVFDSSRSRRLEHCNLLSAWNSAFFCRVNLLQDSLDLHVTLSSFDALLYGCFIVRMLYCTDSFLYGGFIAQMLYCTEALLYGCFNVRMLYCTDALLYGCFIVRMLYCTDALMYGCFTARMLYCTDALLHGCFIVQMLYCTDASLYGCFESARGSNFRFYYVCIVRWRWITYK